MTLLILELQNYPKEQAEGVQAARASAADTRQRNPRLEDGMPQASVDVKYVSASSLQMTYGVSAADTGCGQGQEMRVTRRG